MATRRSAKRPARNSTRRNVTPLLELAATWPFVTRKYMFGCDALLAGGRLFFIEMEKETVLRVGRENLNKALRTRGSRAWNPWKPGEPGDWISFPPARREISKGLAEWARAAYELSLTRKPAARKKPRMIRGRRTRPGMR